MDTHARASSEAGSGLGITGVLTEEVGERRKPGGRGGQGWKRAGLLSFDIHKGAWCVHCSKSEKTS